MNPKTLPERNQMAQSKFPYHELLDRPKSVIVSIFAISVGLFDQKTIKILVLLIRCSPEHVVLPKRDNILNRLLHGCMLSAIGVTTWMNANKSMIINMRVPTTKDDENTHNPSCGHEHCSNYVSTFQKLFSKTKI